MNNAADTEKEMRALERELIDSKETIKQMNKRAKEVEQRISALKKEIEFHKPKALIVSDHAILRYAERHYQLPVKQIRAEIQDKLAGAADVAAFKFMGFVIREKTVVSYVPQIWKQENPK